MRSVLSLFTTGVARRILILPILEKQELKREMCLLKQNQERHKETQTLQCRLEYLRV